MKDRGRASSPRLNSRWLFRWLFRMLSCGYSATNATNTQHTTYKIVRVIVHGMAAALLEFDTLLGVM